MLLSTRHGIDSDSSAVSALYKMNNMLMKAIFAIFATEIVLMTTLLVFAVPKQRYSPQCSSIYTPRIFIGYWSVTYFNYGLPSLMNDNAGYHRSCSRHFYSSSLSQNFLGVGLDDYERPEGDHSCTSSCVTEHGRSR